MNLPPWSLEQWQELERRCCEDARHAITDSDTWNILSRYARNVLRTYSTSFFIVTRFLPSCKRAQVEMVYAAVRQPDEIVDTFPLPQTEQERLINVWRQQYVDSLTLPSTKAALDGGIPPFLAGFTQIVREAGIPQDYYHAFLDAMFRDIRPRPFETMDDLIDDYIYGSAVVVGFFLTYIYGASSPSEFDRALASAQSLGIALQLTNFARDIGEDQRRGRLYVPLDMLRRVGITKPDVNDSRQQAGWLRAIRWMTASAETHYANADADLDAFHPDSRMAIQACIRVYRELNNRIGRSPDGILHRESVPFWAKFRVLPRSKYWRLPLAYLSS